MSHTHGHGESERDGPVVHHRLLLWLVALIGVSGVVGMLWPPPESSFSFVMLGQMPGTRTPVDGRLLNGRIVGIEVAEDALEDPTLMPGALQLDVTVELEGGEEIAFPMTDDTGDTFQVGQRVKVAEVPNEGGGPSYYISDFQRGRPLLLLVGLFLAAVIWFGRLQGVRALLGLVVTLLVISGFLVPGIMAGKSPVVQALSCAAVIMIVTLYLSHGFHPKTTAAVVGTAFALVLTGLLSWVFVHAAAITGMTSEEARLATFEVGGLSLRGMLLASIVIGGLGVLDDVTMSQASTVVELRRANPRATFPELMRGGIRVGRDHIAATVNTLFLAYAGASLPLLVLFTISPDSLGTIVTSEVVAVEVVRTLVGSVGLIVAVPLTTALAAALVPQTPMRTLSTDSGSMRVQSGPDGAQSAPATEGEWEQRLRESYGLPPRPADPGD